LIFALNPESGQIDGLHGINRKHGTGLHRKEKTGRLTQGVHTNTEVMGASPAFAVETVGFYHAGEIQTRLETQQAPCNTCRF